MDGCFSNLSNKIWIFWSSSIICNVFSNHAQMITCLIKNSSSNTDLFISSVYAKSKSVGREELWDHMRAFSSTISGPWIVCGDYNSILNAEEKLGGAPHRLKKSLPFLDCINDCGLTDLGYFGHNYTWCNERKNNDVIWKRLDRVLANDEWTNFLPNTTVQHLTRTSSDHCPLLVSACNDDANFIKYFRFLNFWEEQPDFYNVVKLNWNPEVNGNIFWIFHQKLKRLSKALCEWSRTQIGDIFLKTQQLETMRQKANLRWYKEGDENTKIFHSVVKGRRKLLNIYRIKVEDQWVEGDENIGAAAVNFYQDLFKEVDRDIINLVPRMVSEEENNFLIEEASHEEVKRAVFDIDPNSSAGPDGFNGFFFQKTWDIVGDDLVNMVKAVIRGHQLPKFFTNTCLVLIPKSDNPQSFTDFKPISLSNVSQKIVSKVLNDRLSRIIPKIISQNQSGFVKDRSIGENVLLAQEIIHNIRKPNKGGNVIIKLDMSKAYDRLSWNFLCIVMRKMGFSEQWIMIIWNLLSNMWYSVIINGRRHGFFQSYRGVKQGDLISPSLFIIVAEVLTRLLNKLFDIPRFSGFNMQSNGPMINHLSYADDIIIFCAGKTYTIQLIIEALNKYENNSGQLINKAKCCFLMADDTPIKRRKIVAKLLKFQEKEFPIIYLGCPLFAGRKRVHFFTDMVTRIVQRIGSWHNRFLSTGGRIILIKHVLSAMPMHLLSICQPPKTTIQQIEKAFANFFWGSFEGKNKYHWASWDKLCYPTAEGGIGVRSLQDTSDAFAAKLWWNFRTKDSLWTEFMRAKYSQRVHPMARKWNYSQSHTWRRMMHIIHRVDHLIFWKIHSGNSSFWWDNWLGNGKLADFVDASTSIRIHVADFIIDGRWDVCKLSLCLPPDKVQEIQRVTISSTHLKDQPVWTVSTDGRFNCRSAWNSVRECRNNTFFNRMIWHQKSPFKISFFLWRLLKHKVAVDNNLKRLGCHGPSKCNCCLLPDVEDEEHLFCKSRISRTIWLHFNRMMGIRTGQHELRQVILTWWMTRADNPIQKLILRVAPSIIIWQIWKSRYKSRFENSRMSYNGIILMINQQLNLVTHNQSPRIPPFMKWYHFYDLIDKAKPDISVTPVKWFPPRDGWLKLNTDGCSKGNPGLSGGGGVIRNHQGKLISAFSSPLGCMTNNLSEATALQTGLKWCIDNAIRKIEVESDSLMLIKWIQNFASMPWNLQMVVMDIRTSLESFEDFKIQHCFREANKVADTLANTGLECNQNIWYTDFTQLPRQAKGEFNLDKLGLPSFRTKQIKNSFSIDRQLQRLYLFDVP
ncbi:uncharacterized protein LOC132639298 [Lycium barbarum]|uniref:uncharacterized protein LOC132639298 n=1 Tax=Lycium barbarum TaxID=112863 RepID=UPI00293F30CE|nr:uncharacterized protein LOC132639298 [Lycium barbarum]